jgi:DNA-binding MarR family transcriptional regulator
MKGTKTEKQNRAELVTTIVRAYMDLFMTMQFTSVSHWLMLELTFAQTRALFMLAARNELTVSELARLLGVGNPTASVLVQQLVERGLVTRSEHPADRRQTVIRLSTKGLEIGSGRQRQRSKQWHRWLSHLSDEELSALAHGLSAIVEVIKTELEDEMQRTDPARSKAEHTLSAKGS